MTRLNDPLGRSWVRRGYQNPTPTWGQSVPDLWAETPVVFTRSVQRLNEYGGFEGDVATVIWSTVAHVELIQLSNKPFTQDQASGPLVTDSHMIYVAYPIDPLTLPQNGDYASFLDSNGRSVKLRIKEVNSFNGLNDHLEIQAVSYQ